LTFCQYSLILSLTDAVFDRAAELWAHSYTIGRPQKDADLLIAATALEHGLTLVSGNTADFSWIPGITLEDWRQP
jgi:tRNA(fMet)-specific endonuclease VapC